MFSPLGALSALGTGFLKGKDEAADSLTKQYDLMGMEALGRAFQMPGQPPTISPIPGIGQPGPTPPNPGQASVPAQPALQPMGPSPPGPPMAAAAPGGPGGPPQAPPVGPALPAGGAQMPPQQPQAGPPGMGGGQMGGGMLDLQTLIQRIQQANPNLPPQAMYSALTRAAPLLNLEGKQQLMMLRQQMQQQNLDLRRDTMDLRRDRLDLDRERLDDQKKQNKPDDSGNISGYSPQAIEAAAEHFINTGQFPPGLRDRQGGNALRSAIANRAAEIVDERKITAKDVDKRRQEFKAEQLAINRFMSGPQGNTIRSLGVVVDHLTTMRELAVALQNNDVQALNRIYNGIATQFGVAAPSNASTAAQIVGSEVIKALGIAGAGTKEERQESANAFANAKSPEQLIEAIDKVVKPLMLGQLKGLRRQFKVATGLKEEKFDALLGDEAQQFFGGGGVNAPAAPAGPAAPQTPAQAVQSRFPQNAPVSVGGGWSIQRVP